jgi:hypothetical protein
MSRCFACALLLLIAPSSAFAWGAAAHRYLMRRAIDLLPPDIKPFFEQNREEVVLRVNDPDLWRVAGWDDDPNHFIDFGAEEFGRYPFTALPREYGAAIEKFGMATLKRYGVLPWREAEEFGNLRRSMESFKRNAIYAPIDTVLFAAVAAHYIQDAHQPLHATINYDGQLSGQKGIHARFEAELFERFEPRLAINPAPPTRITSARDATFEIALQSYQLVDALLRADKDAITGKRAYDDAYFEAFLAKVKPMLERRLAESITATASVIISAWEQAGRPALRTK